MASRARKVEFEGGNLDFSSLREENGLTKDEFRKGVLLYLCYGGNEKALLVNNVAITVPILNYIFIRPLLEQLFEFILESPNPFTMQKRICVGGHHPIHLPKSLSLTARVMASKGIQPQVRSDDKEIYNFFNGHLKRVRLLAKIKNLEDKMEILERENHHLHILVGMKMEPLDEEPMDTLSASRNRQAEIGKPKSASRSRQAEIGKPKSASRNRQAEVGKPKSASRNRQAEFDKPNSTSRIRQAGQ
ncbi:hypothetical protein niasHT_018364 [Heterodera trifolii]|uniref:Uncharacterized protein n=1 Tax=Heterodera trifolii TaxID=157864 RepID=A0ABD2LDB2_9BILA